MQLLFPPPPLAPPPQGSDGESGANTEAGGAIKAAAVSSEGSAAALPHVYRRSLQGDVRVHRRESPDRL